VREEISGGRKTELKPTVLWTAPHQTRTRTYRHRFDIAQALPQAMQFAHICQSSAP